MTGDKEKVNTLIYILILLVTGVSSYQRK